MGGGNRSKKKQGQQQPPPMSSGDNNTNQNHRKASSITTTATATTASATTASAATVSFSFSNVLDGNTKLNNNSRNENSSSTKHRCSASIQSHNSTSVHSGGGASDSSSFSVLASDVLTSTNSSHHSKEQQQQQHQQYRRSISNNSNNNKGGKSNSNNSASAVPRNASFDLAEALLEVEQRMGPSPSSYSSSLLYFNASWKDLVKLGLFVLAFAGISIFIGVATGISISIHYYDSTTTSSPSIASSSQQPQYIPQYHHQHPPPPDLDDAGGLDRYNSGTNNWMMISQRVTTLDPMIVYSNSQLGNSQQHPQNLFSRYFQEPSLFGTGSTTRRGGYYFGLVEESPPLLAGTKTTDNDHAGNNNNNGTNDVNRVIGSIGTESINNSTSASYPARNIHIEHNSIHDGGSWMFKNLQYPVVPVYSHETDTSSYNNYYYHTNKNLPPQQPPAMNFVEWTTVQPTLCPDGATYGFDTWYALQAAIAEANYFSAERFVRWHEYYQSHRTLQQQQSQQIIEPSSSSSPAPLLYETFEDNSLYYDEEIVFTICPGTTLKATHKQQQQQQQASQIHTQNRNIMGTAPLFIDAENIILECDGCILDISQTGGTHLSFGSNAQNVFVHGITFVGATTSSLLFAYDNADVTLEDCVFKNNRAKYKSYGKSYGNVAEITSTSNVNFYRCYTTAKNHRSSVVIPYQHHYNHHHYDSNNNDPHYYHSNPEYYYYHSHQQHSDNGYNNPQYYYYYHQNRG